MRGWTLAPDLPKRDLMETARPSSRDARALGAALAATEQALREAQERFRSAFEFAPIGMALVALDGGDDGLDVVRRVVRGAARLLRPGGWLLTEVGGRQDRMLEPVLSAAGYSSVEVWADDDGELRGLAARFQRLVRPRFDVGP